MGHWRRCPPRPDNTAHLPGEGGRAPPRRSVRKDALNIANSKPAFYRKKSGQKRHISTCKLKIIISFPSLGEKCGRKLKTSNIAAVKGDVYLQEQRVRFNRRTSRAAGNQCQVPVPGSHSDTPRTEEKEGQGKLRKNK